MIIDSSLSHGIDSSDSEGEFAQFLDNLFEVEIESALSGEIKANIGGPRGSEIFVEIDNITAPTFTYASAQDSQSTGGQHGGNGEGESKLTFGMPMERFMELVRRRLGLPLLTREGQGRIHDISYQFKTYGPRGVILDKRRTFRRALRSAVALGLYAPDKKLKTIPIRRKDRRFRLPEKVERPRFRASVFYIGDVSYSTYGERLDIEKHVVNFIQNWLDYNYGHKNVEHRFFVHEAQAYEVAQQDFYRVQNAGGTMAHPAFELVYHVATTEYDPQTTNLYAFYFGDGELWDEDIRKCAQLLQEGFNKTFNRVGITEVMASSGSQLINHLKATLKPHNFLRFGRIKNRTETVPLIQTLFQDPSGEKKP